jgi:hypothetical protein
VQDSGSTTPQYRNTADSQYRNTTIVHFNPSRIDRGAKCDCDCDCYWPCARRQHELRSVYLHPYKYLGSYFDDKHEDLWADTDSYVQIDAAVEVDIGGSEQGPAKA